MPLALLPWHRPAWAALASRSERLAHALLLAGPPGVGKQRFASLLAQTRLCRAARPPQLACGECGPCRWFAEGNHPDFSLVQPEAEAAEGEAREGARKASRQIRIEQVRALQDWLAVGAHQGGWRIALLAPADAMNPNTGNALLKTLEEPPPQTLLLLVSARPDLLLPTIRSRCQALPLPAPSRDEAERWLAEQGVAEPAPLLAIVSGSPLRALERPETLAVARALAADLADRRADPLARSAQHQQLPLADVIDLLQKWAQDMARTLAGFPSRYYPGCEAALARAVRGLALVDVVRFGRRLVEARRLVEHPLNARLVMDELFIAYARLGGEHG